MLHRSSSCITLEQLGLQAPCTKVLFWRALQVLYKLQREKRARMAVQAPGHSKRREQQGTSEACRGGYQALGCSPVAADKAATQHSRGKEQCCRISANSFNGCRHCIDEQISGKGRHAWQVVLMPACWQDIWSQYQGKRSSRGSHGCEMRDPRCLQLMLLLAREERAIRHARLCILRQLQPARDASIPVACSTLGQLTKREVTAVTRAAQRRCFCMYIPHPETNACCI